MTLSISACGSADSTSLEPSNVIGAKELARYPAGSVERAFFEFWSALQYRAWAEVAAYYDPQLRDFVGTATLIRAKKLEESSFALLKPRIVKVAEKDSQISVYYALRLANGFRELGSTTWQEDDGNWRIIYDSRLDTELNQQAQNKVELKLNGELPTEASEVSSDAKRAGNAASGLQAGFVEEIDGEETP